MPPSADDLARTLPTVGASSVELVGDRYELRRELARGGQSQVWVAFDRQLGREVAFKVPLPGSDGKVPRDAEARFLREARITARLDHPNIITVHEIGRTADGRLFCAQRLVQGGADGRVDTLARAMQSATGLTQRLALLPRLLDVSNAVAFAHQNGVVHRDLKPDNVVLGRLGETVLLDWGLGRVLGEEDASASSLENAGTLDGQVFGTPLYMSPEQARGERAKVGTRSDVWSLGVMLYELLSGGTPFSGQTLVQVIEQVRSAPVPSVTSVAPDVPRALAAIVTRALQRDETKRYSDATAFAADLSAFLEGRTVGAHDYSAGELVRLAIRRNPAASLIGAIAFGVLLIAVIALARSVRSNREALAEAFVEKGRQAEQHLRWEEAATWYASARELSSREDAAAGLRVVWPRARQEGARLLFGHVGPVRALVSTADGKTLYSSGADHSVRAWDVGEGKALRVFEGHTAAVNALALSGDGARLFSGGEDDEVRTWDVKTGSSQVLVKLPDAINALAVSPDGTGLLIACEDAHVRLVDLATRQVRELGQHTHPVYAAVFSPDGQTVASGSWDGEVQVRSVETGELIATLHGHVGSVLSLAFNRLGTQLVSAGRDTTVRVWSSKDWREIQVLTGNTQKVYAVAWSDSGEFLASAGSDGTSRVWIGANRRPLVGASMGRDDELHTTTFLRGTSVLVTGGRRGLITVRPLPDRGVLSTEGHDVRSLTELADGSVAMQHNAGFAIVSADLRVLAIHPERSVQDQVLAPHRDVVLTRDGALAIGTADDDTLRFYDVKAERVLAVLTAHTEQIEQIALSPDESLVATAGKDGRLFIWNVAKRELHIALPQVHDGLFGVAFSPDGKWLASAGYDRRIRLYETKTWSEVRVLHGHEHGVRAVEFSPDSTLLASGGWDRAVRLFRVADGETVGTLYGHQDVVTSLSFSRDGKRLVSGSFDGSIRMWDVAKQVEVVRFSPDEGRVNRVLISRDGRQLYYVRQELHRIALVDEDLPSSLDEVLTVTQLTMDGLRLRWAPR